MNHLEEQEYLIRLGKRVKEIRLEKGLTQSDCGVDDRTIRRIENPREIFNPSFLVLCEISVGMKISLSEIVNFEI